MKKIIKFIFLLLFISYNLFSLTTNYNIEKLKFTYKKFKKKEFLFTQVMMSCDFRKDSEGLYLTTIESSDYFEMQNGFSIDSAYIIHPAKDDVGFIFPAPLVQKIYEDFNISDNYSLGVNIKAKFIYKESNPNLKYLFVTQLDVYTSYNFAGFTISKRYVHNYQTGVTRIEKENFKYK